MLICPKDLERINFFDPSFKCLEHNINASLIHAIESARKQYGSIEKIPKPLVIYIPLFDLEIKNFDSQKINIFLTTRSGKWDSARFDEKGKQIIFIYNRQN